MIYFSPTSCPKFRLVRYLANLCSYLPLLYYYIILRSSTIFCLSSRDIHLSLGISLSGSIFSVLFLTAFKLLCDKVFETFVILSVILLTIKSPVASAFFELLFLRQFQVHL